VDAGCLEVEEVEKGGVVHANFAADVGMVVVARGGLGRETEVEHSATHSPMLTPMRIVCTTYSPPLRSPSTAAD